MTSGYHDNSVEGDWRWVDCGGTTDWQRNIWSPGYPGNEREDCGVLLPTGEIDDVVCDLPIIYFLCEVTPKGNLFSVNRFLVMHQLKS